MWGAKNILYRPLSEDFVILVLKIVKDLHDIKATCMLPLPPETSVSNFFLTSSQGREPRLVIVISSVMALSGVPNALRDLGFVSAFHFFTGSFMLSVSAVWELGTRELINMQKALTNQVSVHNFPEVFKICAAN